MIARHCATAACEGHGQAHGIQQSSAGHAAENANSRYNSCPSGPRYYTIGPRAVARTMRAVIQRVSQARVLVDQEVVGQIGRGLLVLLGVARDDTAEQAGWLADKVVSLRVFEDEAGKINLGVADIVGEILVVSQFTLYGDCRKGRRPSFLD